MTGEAGVEPSNNDVDDKQIPPSGCVGKIVAASDGGRNPIICSEGRFAVAGQSLSWKALSIAFFHAVDSPIA